jgi:hypothetical protein
MTLLRRILLPKLFGKWPKASQTGSDMGNNRPIWVPSTPLGGLRNPYFGILSDFPNSFSTHSGE